MVKIIFGYNLLKDSQNIRESTQKFGPKISIFLENKYSKKLENKRFFNQIIKSYESYWKINKRELIQTLEEIFKKPLYLQRFYAYLTSCSRCPYNPKESSFYISIFASPLQVIYTIAHELFHLQFFNKYGKKINKKFDDKEKFEDFMEDMAVILDYEIQGKFYLDKIKLDKKKKQILLLWKKHKNLDLVVKKLFS